jgi:hypothetical protein
MLVGQAMAHCDMLSIAGLVEWIVNSGSSSAAYCPKEDLRK